MAFFSRARGLFSYGDLNGSVSESRGVSSGSSVHINEPGMMSANEKYRRRKRRTLIGVALLAVVVILIIALSSRQSEGVSSALKRLPKSFSSASGTYRHPTEVKSENRVKFQDFIQSRFVPTNYPDFNATWISDKEFMLENFYDGLQIFDVETLSAKKLMSSSLMNHYKVYDYYLSQDRAYLLLKTNPSRIYRRSSIAEYIIMPLRDGRVSTTQNKLEPADYNGKEPFLIRYASFAPTGNGVIYVDRDNNIYHRPTALGQDVKLTQNGEEGKIFNGIPDWVFEEEVFEESKAVWWAPDGKKLVWGSFDDTDVEIYLLQSYGKLKHLEQYPFIKDLAYPKVGTKNPIVTLWMCNFDQGPCDTKLIKPPESLRGQEVHFSRVKFIDNHHFAVQWMNRVQNFTVVSLCQTEGVADCIEIFANEEKEGWIEYKYTLYFDPLWTPEKSPVPDFVTILSKPSSKHRYRQVMLVSDQKRTFLTQRNADVTNIAKWSKDGYIYFMAVAEDRPGSEHMYRIPSPNLSNDDLNAHCMSCNLNITDELHQRPCEKFSVAMSEEGSYFIMNCLGPGTPYSCIHRTSTNGMVMVYDDNHKVEQRMKDVELPTIQHMEVAISGSELKAQVKMYLPPEFDPTRQYPMLVYIYGGPGSQHVDLSFNQFEYQTYLAGSKEFIYTIIDPMGTAGQGDKWRYSMYHQFGTVEVTTIQDVTRYLQNNLQYIDPERTAIWGWSYGGFLSLTTLASDAENLFDCGISVAPVADWLLYDTYYTERYMGLPQENRKGYNQSRVYGKLDNLRNKSFYLIHGTDDDNVHYQQSLLISQALEEKDILFRQQSYTDQDHSIGDYREHLYHSITDFLINDCFKEKDLSLKK